MIHVASIAAYPLEEGGFRAVYLDRRTRGRITNAPVATLEEARKLAQRFAYDRHHRDGFKLAPLRRRGEYRANVWIEG